MEWHFERFYFMRCHAYFDYLACPPDGKQPENLILYLGKKHGLKKQDSIPQFLKEILW